MSFSALAPFGFFFGLLPWDLFEFCAFFRAPIIFDEPPRQTPPAAPATSATGSAPQGGAPSTNWRSKENEDRAARHPRPEPAEEVMGTTAGRDDDETTTR